MAAQRLLQVSGQEVVRLLLSLGYAVMRQRGSHIRLRKVTLVGAHNVTVPNHSSIAKGTLSDILHKVSIWNNIPREELIANLR
ncbi:MAG: type II toxin-antitoxin system HicA family toxin [Dehalococcoidia bacterium]|nr:type II toxin-antitoxin system HicA family toxin [Dehalococcoidia bacterium]